MSSFMGCCASFDEASIILAGMCFDSTVSYRPGTRFAPGSIRQESFGIETYSPYLEKDLSEISVSDIGDIDIPEFDRRVDTRTERALERLADFSNNVSSKSKIPFLLGGEHLLTFGMVKGLASIYKDLHILQFDAHADLREHYEGEKLSHACAIRRCIDIVGSNRVFQLGIRSMTKEEDEFARKNTYQCKFNFEKIEEYISKLQGKPVYITIDIDVLDPAFLPGTGTPEPCGVTTNELLGAIYKCKNLNVVGIDLMELSPHYDLSGVSTVVATKLVREILLTFGK